MTPVEDKGSGRPLVRKLGVKPDTRVAWLGAPEGFDGLVGELPPGVEVLRSLRPPLDLLVQFTTSRTALARRLPQLRDAVFPAGVAWIAWPKRNSGVPTDVTEDVVREEALPIGLVDVKVCAIDATWSGLKLVVRKEQR
jgi:hypothetical protein